MVWQEVFDNHVKVLILMLFMVACCNVACISKFREKICFIKMTALDNATGRSTLEVIGVIMMSM